MNHTIYGRYLLALGRNEEAAKYSGINTDRMLILAYVICSLLAGLGVYGKAYDQVLEQFSSLQEQVDEAQSHLTERRKQAEDLYKSLIKRGTAVEREALKALADLELDSLADRSKLEAQMKKAKSRFDDLKSKFGKAA